MERDLACTGYGDALTLLNTMKRRRVVRQETTLDKLYDLPQDRSDVFSTPSSEVMRSGALPGSKAEFDAFVSNTKDIRIEAFQSLDKVTIQETHGYRVRTAYRLVSAMSRCIGMLSGIGTVTPILNRFPNFCHVADNQLPGSEGIHRLAVLTGDMGDVFSLDYGEIDTSGMSLLPPPIADRFYHPDDTYLIVAKRTSGRYPDDYDPENDPLLAIWCRIYGEMARFLGMGYGSKEDPLQDVYGLQGMMEPTSARFLWPSDKELAAFEVELLLWVFDFCSKHSIRKSEQKVIDGLGYSRPEAIVLVKAATEFGNQIYADATNNTRIIENKRLDHLFDKALTSSDYRASMVIRKQAHLINGLTKDSAESSMDDFEELAKYATGKDGDQNLIE